MREQHLMLLHFTTQETLNTESGSVDEAWKKRRTCIVLDWIAPNLIRSIRKLKSACLHYNMHG